MTNPSPVVNPFSTMNQSHATNPSQIMNPSLTTKTRWVEPRDNDPEQNKKELLKLVPANCPGEKIIIKS